MATFVAYGYNNAFMVITPLLVVDIGSGYSEAGMQGTVFLVVAIGLRFYFGPLADRYGVKLVMALGLGSFVVSGILLTGCSQFWQLLCVRCLQAVGLSAFFPSATATISLISPEDKAGFFLGVYRFVGAASLLLGPLVAVFLSEQIGYGWCFLIFAGSALVALLLILIMPLRKTKKQATEKTTFAGLVKALIQRDSRTMLFALAATLLASLGYGLLFSFASLFIGEVQPDMNAGFYFTIVGIGGLVANPLVGWLSDKVLSEILIMASLFFMGSGIALLGLLPAVPWIYFASGILAGLGYAGGITAILMYILTRVDSSRHASAFALQQNGIDLGIACASGIFGFVFAMVTSGGWVFMAWGGLTILIVVVGGLVSRLIKNPR